MPIQIKIANLQYSGISVNSHKIKKASNQVLLNFKGFKVITQYSRLKTKLKITNKIKAH